MMSLRIYWRSKRTRRCVAELVIAAALVAPMSALAGPDPKATPPRVTAREAVETQLSAPPARPGTMTGAEAARIQELYLARIGKMLEPRREIESGNGPR